MINRTQHDIMQKWGGKSDVIVSICCITYNHENYISQAIDGFLMQDTTFPIEILIHDDASTDKTADIIRKYEQIFPHIIKPIYQKENQYSKGVDVFALNAKHAKGKYVAICEGDDYWTDPYKLQKQVDFMETHSEYSMCFHRVTVSSEIEWERHIFDHLCERDYSDRQIFEKWTVPTCSVMYRSFPFQTNKKVVYSDIFLWLQLAEIGKLHCFNFNGGVYRRHERGVSVLNDYSLYPSLAKQYKYLANRFPHLKDIARRDENINLKIVIHMPYFRDLWKFRFRYMLLHPKLFFSTFFTTTLLSCTPLRHH